MVLPDEGLHHADGGDVLLNAGVQVIVAPEDLVEDFHGDHHDGPQHHDQEHHSDQEGEAQLGADDKAHDVAEDQHQRGTHRDADDHHEGILHVGDVGGHTGDQAGYAELVDVGEGKGLDVVVDGLPQVGRQAGGGAGREFAGRRAEGQAQQSQNHHYDSVTVNHRQIGLLQAPVNDDRGDKGQQDLHDDFQGAKPDAQECVPLEAPKLMQYSPHDCVVSFRLSSVSVDKCRSSFCCIPSRVRSSS